MIIKNLSVFFPSFNEEKNITATVEKAIDVLSKLDIPWEITVVNDGSKDKTGEVAEGIAKKYPSKIKVIHQPNGGYGMALRAGFYSAKYDWIVYTDSDGQFDFAEVSKFIEKTDIADVLLGYRIKRSDPPIRLFIAKGWAFLLFIFFGMRLKDIDCGFKMLSRSALKKISPLESTRGGMINAEIAIKSNKEGLKIIQIGVNHYPRLAGKPTGAGLRVIITSLLELIKLWVKLR